MARIRPLYFWTILSLIGIAAIVVMPATGILTTINFYWAQLPETSRQLIAVFLPILIALIGLVFGFFQFLHSKHPIVIQPEPQFGFDRFSTNALDPLEKELFGQYAALEYQPRFVGQRQEALEKQLDTQLLMVTGRSGLGKTRECIELFKRLAQRAGEDFTILRAHQDFDRPTERAIPSDWSPRNIILFIDDIDQRCVLPPRDAADGTNARSFHDRLSATIGWMQERYAGRDWRVVLTARDEPELRARLRLNANVWSGFTQFQLPGVHRAAREPFLRAVASYFRLDVEPGATQLIVGKSDGTCSGIITALARESSRRNGKPGLITLDNMRDYDFRYPADWERNVYATTISAFPYRRCVFEALSSLYQLRLPAQFFLVVDLAARLCDKGRWRWIEKRKITRSIRRDLRAWMFDYRGVVICPTAYIEERIDLGEAIPAVTSSLVRFSKGKDQFRALLPLIPEVSKRLGVELGFVDEGITIVQAWIKRAPTFAPLLTAAATLLDRAGKSQDSLQAAQAAVSADDQSPFALVALAYAQTRTGAHSLAVDTARQATLLAPKYDFVWLNLGVVLSKRRMYNEAISALRTACELNSRNAKAWYSLGVAYDRVNQHDKAIAACDQATSLDPLDHNAWHILGIAHDRSGNSEKAVAALRRAQQLDDTDASVWVSLSRALTSDGRKQEGLESLRTAAKRATDPDLLSRISVGFGKNGESIEAVEAARAALKIDPLHVDASISLALNLSMLPAKSEEVQEAFCRAKEVCVMPDNWYDLSVAYGMHGNYSEAAAAAQRAIDANPSHADAWRSLAINLSKFPARPDYQLYARQRAAELCDSPDRWLELAIAYRRAGLHGEAIAAADMAIALDAEHVGAWRARAMSLARLSREEDAGLALQQVQELVGPDNAVMEAQALEQVNANPESSTAWRHLATVYSNGGRPIEAIALAHDNLNRNARVAPHILALVEELLRQAPKAIASLLEDMAALGGQNAQYMHLLGVVRLKVGDSEGAVEPLRASCSINPYQAHYWYVLGKALHATNRHVLAKEAFERSLAIKPNYIKALDALRGMDNDTAELQ
ncbi:MAG: tetratricopeptide repeat protein [Pirellulales bacterium]